MNNQNIGIAFFAKDPAITPRLQIKSRLAACAGVEAALQCYECCLNCAEDLMHTLPQNIQPYWALANDADATNWRNFPVIPATAPALGDNLHHVYNMLLAKHDIAILVGTDSPQLTKQHIVTAITQLTHQPYCIGPAADGGFYLFAGQEPITRTIWQQPTYSCKTTRQDLITALPSNIATLPALTDLDTAPDIPAIMVQMPPHKTTAQNALVQVFRTITTASTSPG